MSKKHDTTVIRANLLVTGGRNTGQIVQRTAKGLAVLVTQLDEATKERLASLFNCAPQDLENANGHTYARIYLDSKLERDEATGLDVVTDGPITKALADKAGSHTADISFGYGRLRPYLVMEGPFAGERRYELAVEAMEVHSAKRFSVFDFPPGSFKLPVAIAPARPSRVMAAAAGEPSAAEKVAATPDLTASAM